MLGFFQTYRKNLKIPDLLDFIGFLHTHVYVCHIRSLEYDKKNTVQQLKSQIFRETVLQFIILYTNIEKEKYYTIDKNK